MINESPVLDPGPAAKVEEPLAAIRRHTAGLHERVEGSVGLEERLASIESYGALLRQYLRLYVTLEALLSQLRGEASVIAGKLYRPKVTLLRRDLELLGTGSAVDARPADPDLFPDLSNVDALFGALYVVEGSALGGRFIARQVQQVLQLTADSGAAFFTGEGEATSAHWKDVTATLNRRVGDASVAAEAARKMFLAFELCLNAKMEGERTR